MPHTPFAEQGEPTVQAEDLARNDRFRAEVLAGRYASELAPQYGVGETFAKTAARMVRFAAEQNAPAVTTTTEEASDGTRSVEAIRDRPVTLADARDWITSSGDNPDNYRLSIRSIAYGRDMFSNRMSATPIPGRDNADTETTADFLDRIRSFTYKPTKHTTRDESLVIVPTDLQLGKVDWNGGTDDTLAQVLTSFHRAAEIAQDERPAEIVIVDAGDIIENIYSTSSQLATNDIDLPRQVSKAMEVMLEGIKILAPHAPTIRYAAVSSNHGAHRLGPKAPAGDVHADYGIAIARILATSLRLNEAAFGHVTVQIPDPYMESLAFETSGTSIGVVHGHQAGNADKIGDWWKGQTHGRMPTADARILIAGHFHSLRVQQSGDARWIMVGPASDRGSSWFTNLKGEQSESGMLSFLTSGNTWRELRII